MYGFSPARRTVAKTRDLSPATRAPSGPKQVWRAILARGNSSSVRAIQASDHSRWDGRPAAARRMSSLGYPIICDLTKLGLN